MQPMESISEVDWTSLTSGEIMFTEEDFMSHLLHNIDLAGLPSPNHHTSFYPFNSPPTGFPQMNFYDNATGHNFHDPYLNPMMTQHNPVLCGGGSHSAEPDVVQGDDYLNRETEEEAVANCSSSNMRKRSRSAENVKEMKRNDRLKKNKSSIDLLSACSSEDDSIESQKNGEEGLSRSSKKPPRAVNLSGKTRATRGSATDPQSVYARKRRERINERLKTLQNLIPNGTKVDISTMLEEAVHYVKFLQHQIKLLSSDEHWMYAPIAYNGTNVGLDLNFNALR